MYIMFLYCYYIIVITLLLSNKSKKKHPLYNSNSNFKIKNK